MFQTTNTIQECLREYDKERKALKWPPQSQNPTPNGHSWDAIEPWMEHKLNLQLCRDQWIHCQRPCTRYHGTPYEFPRPDRSWLFSWHERDQNNMRHMVLFLWANKCINKTWLNIPFHFMKKNVWEIKYTYNKNTISS